MDTLKVLIVEDEVLIAEDLKDILHSFGIKEVTLAHTKEEAILALKTVACNAVLLDIRMENEFDGFELGGLINEKYGIPFIYVTSHSDIESVKHIMSTKPAGYITKPFKKSDLFAALTNINETLAGIRRKSIIIRDGYTNILLKTDEIMFVQSEGNYINIICESKKIVSRQSLESFIQEAGNSDFFRVHRSYYVNLNKIIKYDSKNILIGKTEIPVSRNIQSQLHELIKSRA